MNYGEIKLKNLKEVQSARFPDHGKLLKTNDLIKSTTTKNLQAKIMMKYYFNFKIEREENL